ncbi:MAG: hypothetical protein Q4A15_13230 [Prevotellaceae bacterium]|nr:hypothetical protein [Prevotellaceae bacterium]
MSEPVSDGSSAALFPQAVSAKHDAAIIANTIKSDKAFFIKIPPCLFGKNYYM